MSFTTIIVGNGLGRALDHKYYPLKKGIKSVWESDLEDRVKKSILSCLPQEGEVKPTIPTSEDDLLTLHEVTNSCRKLRSLEPKKYKWLTSKFRVFPEAIDEFVARVSYYYHQYDVSKLTTEYDKFVEGISKYIKRNCTHVATLNYDNLLSQPLIEKEVLKGYSGHLIDGFHSSGFAKENLNRRNKTLGWYLHLHGSPLFYESDSGKIKKYSQAELADSFNAKEILRRHVVLCHTKNKPSVIVESGLLKTYWNYFSKALRQTDVIYLVGYGGGDEHLNKQISNWAEQQRGKGQDYQITIVEYKGMDTTLPERRNFWLETFSIEYKFPSANLKIKRLNNILTFDWDKE